MVHESGALGAPGLELEHALDLFRSDLRSSCQLETYDSFSMEFCVSLGSDPSAFGELHCAALDLVPFDVAADFQGMYGEIYPFVPEWVTSKPRNGCSRWGAYEAAGDALEGDFDSRDGGQPVRSGESLPSTLVDRS